MCEAYIAVTTDHILRRGFCNRTAESIQMCRWFVNIVSCYRPMPRFGQWYSD
jgi:hypothetical protein